MSGPAAVKAHERKGTGLEFLQRIVSGEIAGVPIGITLGFRMAEVDHGRVVFLGRPDERSYNIIGTVHGGWAAAILDSAMALAIMSTLDARSAHTAVDIQIKYLRPITLETGEVRAEGRVLHGGRRMALSQAELTDGAGKLLAHGTSTCLILPKA